MIIRLCSDRSLIGTFTTADYDTETRILTIVKAMPPFLEAPGTQGLWMESHEPWEGPGRAVPIENGKALKRRKGNHTAWEKFEEGVANSPGFGHTEGSEEKWMKSIHKSIGVPTKYSDNEA